MEFKNWQNSKFYEISKFDEILYSMKCQNLTERQILWSFNICQNSKFNEISNGMEFKIRQNSKFDEI